MQIQSAITQVTQTNAPVYGVRTLSFTYPLYISTLLCRNLQGADTKISFKQYLQEISVSGPWRWRDNNAETCSSYWKVVSINHRLVHLLVFAEFFFYFLVVHGMNNVREMPHWKRDLRVVMPAFSAKLCRMKFLWDKWGYMGWWALVGSPPLIAQLQIKDLHNLYFNLLAPELFFNFSTPCI